MATEKLFKPEDFDKEPQKPEKNNKWWIIGGVLALVVVIAAVIGFKSCKTEEASQQDEQLIPASEVIDTVAVDEALVPESPDTLWEETALRVENEPAVTSSEVVADKKPKANVAATPAPQTSLVSSDIDAEAMKVIRGDYGNNPERQSLLGSKYQPIQDRVNELKRQGMF